MGLVAILALALLAAACSLDTPTIATPNAAVGASRLEDGPDDAPALSPEHAGLDSRALIALTEWIRDHPVPIYSLLISRNGTLVYELYTSSLTRAHAHYQMSVTKSFVSALVGVVIDRGLVKGPDAPITETLPRQLFASDADVARFRSVTVRHVLGMSALDAPDPPRVTTPAAIARQRRFKSAPNRLKFALEQPLVATPGRAYQYNDVTPMLATGLVQYAAGESALELAEAALFGPMGYQNYEWMQQDLSGIDLGGFGLRLRPIDMQKFGILYLNGRTWRGQRLLSRGWVERSFAPWNRSRPESRDPTTAGSGGPTRGGRAGRLTPPSGGRGNASRCCLRGRRRSPHLQRSGRSIRRPGGSQRPAASRQPGDPGAACRAAGGRAHRAVTGGRRDQAPDDSLHRPEGAARGLPEMKSCASEHRAGRHRRSLNAERMREPLELASRFVHGRPRGEARIAARLGLTRSARSHERKEA
jgi:CubicO group peptidase (beta-lactamase class C family)